MPEKNSWDMRTALVLLLPFAAIWAAPTAPWLPSLTLFLNLWVLSLYDLRFFRLPNLLTATLFAAGLVHAYVWPRYGFADHLIGAAVGLLFFPLLNAVYRRVRGRDGIGLGDAKLLAGIGMWLGWPALPFVLLVASISGLVFGVYGVATKRVRIADGRIPFGPFLCLGCWLVWLYL